MMDTRERDKYLASRKVLELKPETVAFLRSAIARCETANEGMRNAVAHDRLCHILPVVESSERLCAGVRKALEGEE